MNDFKLDDFGKWMEKINHQENIKCVKLAVNSETFRISLFKNGEEFKSQLIIDRKTGNIKESDKEVINKPPSKVQLKSAFLGILRILDQKFLLFVERVSQRISIMQKTIFEIGDVSLIPFEDESDIFNKSPQSNQIYTYINNLKKIFSFGFFFSFDYDLSISQQKQSLDQDNNSIFLWNSHLMEELEIADISRAWMIYLIQGYVGTFQITIEDKQLEYYLISRRSCKRAGTRYNARGLDDEGNVANLIETEQIFIYENFCCSHVQVRGSAPVFWRQTGIRAIAQVTRQPELSTPAFLKHINFLVEFFDKCYCVNLMSKSKPQEQAITEAFEEQIRINDQLKNRIFYQHFDFHEACQHKDFQKINPLIRSLQNILRDYQFFAYDLQKKQILRVQLGQFRSSCLDSLDRTNVFMTKLAITVFEYQIKQYHADTKQIFGDDLLSQLDENDEEAMNEFIPKFKNIWADNGDVLSKHYSGTGSTISSVTRTGKKTFLSYIDHGMKSVGRFYIGNFEDQFKQECIDIITGKHQETLQLREASLQEILKQKEKDFSIHYPISIYIVTWNLGGVQMNVNSNLKELFNFNGNLSPDLIAIGLQEIIDLTPKNVVNSSNQKIVKFWQILIENNLKSIGDYLFIKQKDLVGINLIIFAKSWIKDRITKVEEDTVKCGVMNKFGNKGSTVIRLNIDDTPICFINTHLETGSFNISGRVQNINDIHQRAFQQEGTGKLKSEKIENMDYTFFFGDTNFRLNLPNQETRDLIQDYRQLHGQKQHKKCDQIIKQLLSNDQLLYSKNNKDFSQYLSKYYEFPIKFLPTYKFDKETDNYDTSKKQRIPSWTDRILIWSKQFKDFSQRYYERKELRFSDHRPVVAYYTIQCKQIDHLKKQEIMYQLTDKEHQVPTSFKMHFNFRQHQDPLTSNNKTQVDHKNFQKEFMIENDTINEISYRPFMKKNNSFDLSQKEGETFKDYIKDNQTQNLSDNEFDYPKQSWQQNPNQYTQFKNISKSYQKYEDKMFKPQLGNQILSQPDLQQLGLEENLSNKPSYSIEDQKSNDDDNKKSKKSFFKRNPFYFEQISNMFEKIIEKSKSFKYKF